jgi:hypothetical protein
MLADRISPHCEFTRFLTGIWQNWRAARTAVNEINKADPDEARRIARDLGVSVPELRELSALGPSAADLLPRRLRSINVDPATVDRAVMQDLQRCCSRCQDKALCQYELEDKPKRAEWPKYCPNEQTIKAIVLGPE